MPSRMAVDRLVPFFFWILAIASVPVWSAMDPGNGWDAKGYVDAIHAVEAGQDPYAIGIAAQTAYHSQLELHPHARQPFAYVYPPLTLPLLRKIGSLPPTLYIPGYWLIYAVGALVPILVSLEATEPGERRVFVFLAPAAAFFPGLIQNDTLKSGNIVYILYGLVFGAAYLGWRRGQWRWFYLATLAASCFKIPMLSLLAIPVLSGRKQWLPACTTASAGLALFLIQLRIWPTYFREYLRSLELVFSYLHDFGLGPAGLFARDLSDAGVAYSPIAAIFYILFALSLFGLLLYLSRQFFYGKFSMRQWIPVMITGVFLLNPRIQEYDVAPLALFMALILWRVISSFTNSARAILFCALFFVVLNSAAILMASAGADRLYWKCIEGFLLTGIFAAGCWNLLRQARKSSRNRCAPADELPVLAP